jgi:hypothetical protein
MRSRQTSIWRELGWGAVVLAIVGAVFLFVYLPR